MPGPGAFLVTDSLVWWIRNDPPAPGPVNMAWDHTLALSCPPGHAVLRLYGWSEPTLSFGLHEPARDRYDRALLEERTLAAVRRPTGGRAVLHHREVTYCVVAPIRALGGVRAAYELVNRALAAGLTRLGASVSLAGQRPVAGPDAGPCFREPAPGEVMALGRKLVGSAQRRVGDNLLQHGSILLEDDQQILREIEGGRAATSKPPEPSSEPLAPSLDSPAPSPGASVTPPESPEATAPATLAALLGRPVSPAEVRAGVEEGFRSVLPGDWRRSAAHASFGPAELPDQPHRDLLERYRSSQWTWRL